MTSKHALIEPEAWLSCNKNQSTSTIKRSMKLALFSTAFLLRLYSLRFIIMFPLYMICDVYFNNVLTLQLNCCSNSFGFVFIFTFFYIRITNKCKFISNLINLQKTRNIITSLICISKIPYETK